jgi:ribosomal-protein-alanine N-acetyltransferase
VPGGLHDEGKHVPDGWPVLIPRIVEPTMTVPEEFVTTRLRVERLTSGHLSALERFHCDTAVMAELGGVRDEQQTFEYLSRNLRHWQEFGFGVWMLREIEGAEIVGRAILRHLDLEGVDEVEIGFALYSKLWGRGLATEIGEACVAVARRELGIQSLVGITTLHNHASQRVLAKLGLAREREVDVEGTPCLLHRIRWDKVR